MPSLNSKSSGHIPDGLDTQDIEDIKDLKRRLKEYKKNQKNEPKVKTFSRIFGYIFKNYKKRFILVVISILIGSVGTAMIPVILTILTNNFIEGGADRLGTLEGLPMFVGIIGALYIVAVGFSTTFNILMARIGQGVLYQIRKDLFTKMQSLPITF